MFSHRICPPILPDLFHTQLFHILFIEFGDVREVKEAVICVNIVPDIQRLHIVILYEMSSLFSMAWVPGKCEISVIFTLYCMYICSLPVGIFMEGVSRILIGTEERKKMRKELYHARREREKRW